MASGVAILGPALVKVHRAENGQLYGYPWSCTGTGSQGREWPAVWLSLVLYWYRFTGQRMASSVAFLGPVLVQVHRAENGQWYGYPWSSTGTGSQSREWPAVWLSLVQHWYRFTGQRMASGVATLGSALVEQRMLDDCLSLYLAEMGS
ncbi:hypothetical protein RRG08_062618 [Elysia crispata]|uniref:Uncharacterized protein n=1 Tax=Elysia crispata TaxID=231223 RepID=A0AAE0YZF0_9GAST|nr:hypothetical protein RRG08_062618 [Elysia crispata]